MPRKPDSRRVEYRPLADLRANPRNPKAHADDTISESVKRFGYIEPIVLDGRTDYIVSGHGRTEALRRAEAAGGEPPEGVMIDRQSGAWLAPVVVGWESGDDLEAAAALIALNRTTELGGWIDETLLQSLDLLSQVEGGLAGVGYTEADIEVLRALTEDDTGGGPEYTRRSDIPQYTPTGLAPEPWELTDQSRTLELVNRIREVEGLPDEVLAFLLAAAHRHTRFNYALIAEFYAHAEPVVQALMEESALVIIDIGDAMRHGYVRLSERMDEILTGDQEDAYDDEPEEATNA